MSELQNFYKNNIHMFYNIDYVEEKYKKICRYKTVSEYSNYFRNVIVEEKSNHDNNIPDNLREVVKKTIYDLFDKPLVEKEITIEQFLKLAKLLKP